MNAIPLNAAPQSTTTLVATTLSPTPLNVRKTNETVNKFLLAGDKLMHEMHLKKPGFTYSSCEPFTKNKERIQKLKETGDTNYIYKN